METSKNTTAPAPMRSAALAGEVLVSWASLDVGEPELLRALELLAPDERERASRFAFPLDRARWIAARALLRRLIAAHVGAEPSDLRFSYSPMGKPTLSSPAAALGFNVSHSGAYAAYAVTGGVEIGVDVEVVRPVPDVEGVAARFFSALENDDLRALPREQRLRAFYECWTRKEAFLKATGDGLTRALDSFSVTLGPHETPRIRHTSPDPEERERWSLLALEPRSGVLVAVAVPRGEWRVRCVEVSPPRAR